MQTMGANMQTIHYALFTGEVMAVDESGYKTGERVKTYDNPMTMRINVSAARGTADVEQFGIATDYERTMVTHDMNCPIKEDTILWIGVSTNDDWNYSVVKVARSINCISYAIKERK